MRVPRLSRYDFACMYAHAPICGWVGLYVSTIWIHNKKEFTPTLHGHNTRLTHTHTHVHSCSHLYTYIHPCLHTYIRIHSDMYIRAQRYMLCSVRCRFCDHITRVHASTNTNCTPYTRTRMRAHTHNTHMHIRTDIFRSIRSECCDYIMRRTGSRNQYRSS